MDNTKRGRHNEKKKGCEICLFYHLLTQAIVSSHLHSNCWCSTKKVLHLHSISLQRGIPAPHVRYILVQTVLNPPVPPTSANPRPSPLHPSSSQPIPSSFLPPSPLFSTFPTSRLLIAPTSAFLNSLHPHLPIAPAHPLLRPHPPSPTLSVPPRKQVNAIS